MSSLRRFSSSSVYSTWGAGFGDMIVIASMLAQLKSIIKISKKADPKFEKVLNLFLDSDQIQMVEEEADVVFFSRDGKPDKHALKKIGYTQTKNFEIVSFVDIFQYPLISPKKYCWKANQSKIIAYSFKAGSRKEKKQIPENQISEFLFYFTFLGYTCLEVGFEVGDEESQRRLSTAEFYVGIDTGLTHLALCIGTPVFLLTHKCELDFIEKHYPRRTLQRYVNVYDLMEAYRGVPNKICFGLTISHESLDLIERCFDALIEVFKDRLDKLLVVFRGSPHREFLLNKYPILEVGLEEDVPIFIRHQELIKTFLNKTTATHFVKIDPDTLVLRWTIPIPNLAGEFAHYKPEHQKSRWEAMPNLWKMQNSKFETQNYLHGINGGFSLICREYCQAIVPFFFEKSINWESKTLRNGFRKEVVGQKTMIGEEQSIAWYLHLAKIKVSEHKYVSNSQELFFTYHGKGEKILNKNDIQVFHPVKNAFTHKQITSTVIGNQKISETSKTYNSFTLGIVFSYESISMLERAILLCLRAYAGYVSSIIIINRGTQDLQSLVDKFGIILLSVPDSKHPNFYYYQEIISFYLKESVSSHLILLDPDTVVLKWDEKFHELAGQKIHYTFKKQQQTYRLTPPALKHYFSKLQNMGCIHAIHGGWGMFGRESLFDMSQFFCSDWSVNWLIETWKIEEQIIEEQILGFYLKMGRRKKGINEPIGMMPEVQEFPKIKYCTDYKNKTSFDQINLVDVFHPIKTNELFLELLNKYSQGENLKQFLIKRGWET